VPVRSYTGFAINGSGKEYNLSGGIAALKKIGESMG